MNKNIDRKTNDPHRVVQTYACLLFSIQSQAKQRVQIMVYSK